MHKEFKAFFMENGVEMPCDEPSETAIVEAFQNGEYEVSDNTPALFCSLP